MSPRAKVAPRDSLAEEEALLEQARQLAGHSPSQALALLQQYQRRFPSGQLAAERMFLSVDVLKRLGNTTGARKQADALIRAFPSSVYAAQVKPQSSTPD
jgi:TolA-binding protein